jgi:hypothetical protein
MQSAETVLSVLRERGRRGLPLNELYRQLFNPQLYLLAYGRIYANKERYPKLPLLNSLTCVNACGKLGFG